VGALVPEHGRIGWGRTEAGGICHISQPGRLCLLGEQRELKRQKQKQKTPTTKSGTKLFFLVKSAVNSQLAIHY
jgi:hypothetical protein